jgi:hypothetical protein
MKRVLVLGFVGFCMLLAACSGIKVATDENKSTDFSKYKTYSFLGWQNGSEKLLEESDKKAMYDAFDKEFQKRDMTFVKGGGDMAVSLFLVLSDELSVSGYSSHYGAGGYGRYSTYGYGYYGGTSTGSFAKKKTEKGTLIMDCFDEKSGEQIWQGIATATIKEDPAKRKGSIPSRINALMMKFPVKTSKK